MFQNWPGSKVSRIVNYIDLSHCRYSNVTQEEWIINPHTKITQFFSNCLLRCSAAVLCQEELKMIRQQTSDAFSNEKQINLIEDTTNAHPL